MKRTSLVLLVLAAAASAMAQAGASGNADNRINLHLTEREKGEFSSQMREMLESVQGIISGIGAGDRDLIARSARNSGNRMARSTPESIREKLPRSFRELGGPMHLMFEELAIRAETDDMDMLAGFTGQLMRQCLACHRMFRAD